MERSKRKTASAVTNCVIGRRRDAVNNDFGGGVVKHIPATLTSDSCKLDLSVHTLFDKTHLALVYWECRTTCAGAAVPCTLSRA